MKRNISFDNRIQDVYLDILHNLFIQVASAYYVEYAIVANPNETTDWTILETVQGTGVEGWLPRTFDFSGVPKTATLWIRIRYNSADNFANDLAFSTWREYSVDIPLFKITGVTKDKDGNVLGSCRCNCFKDNGAGVQPTWIGYALSDPVTGEYTFTGVPDNDPQYYVEAYKEDDPHVFDITDHVLQPVPEA